MFSTPVNSGYSKSMFLNKGGYNGGKTVPNSIIGNVKIPNFFPNDIVENFKIIEEKYTSNLANESYSDIPSDYIEFSKLYSKVNDIQLGVSDSSISVLLQITKEGLKGAMNALGISNQIVELNIKNVILQNQVTQLESGVNKKNVYPSAHGHFHIQKTFTLIPIYSYYIVLFGLPEPGVGFDPLKITQLLNILQSNNIDPYGSEYHKNQEIISENNTVLTKDEFLELNSDLEKLNNTLPGPDGGLSVNELDELGHDIKKLGKNEKRRRYPIK